MRGGHRGARIAASDASFLVCLQDFVNEVAGKPEDHTPHVRAKSTLGAGDTSREKSFSVRACNRLPILDPDSMPLVVWEVVLMVGVLFYSIVVPLRLAFAPSLISPDPFLQSTDSWLALDTFMDVVFICDVAVTARTVSVCKPSHCCVVVRIWPAASLTSIAARLS